MFDEIKCDIFLAKNKDMTLLPSVGCLPRIVVFNGMNIAISTANSYIS
tara:strand:- start:14626 stop:14769 length:144 start_codon:yes stop_codon:yes gene_type:complete